MNFGHNGFKEKGIFMNYFNTMFKNIYMYPLDVSFTHTQQMFDRKKMKLNFGGYYTAMPVCSIVKTITPRCHGRPDALLHETKGIRSSIVPRGNSLTILQTGMK